MKNIKNDSVEKEKISKLTEILNKNIEEQEKREKYDIEAFLSKKI